MTGDCVSTQQIYKIIKKELCVDWSTRSLGVELRRIPRLALVADTLIGAVVHVGEIWFPSLTERAGVYREAMVLAGDEAAVGAFHAHGLVVRTMTVLELINACAGSLGEKLVAHADAHKRTRLCLVADKLADILHCLNALLGVTRTVGDKEAVKLHAVEIIVPWHYGHLHARLSKQRNMLFLAPQSTSTTFFLSSPAP